MAGAIACVFPGQGSQHVGMGRDFHEAHPLAQQTFAEASEVLDLDLASICFEGPEEVLTDTLNAQPAILTLSFALWRVLEAHQAGGCPPIYLAGHSMGEYSALVAAGALGFTDALRLVRRRGELMQAAARERPGGMAALIGLDAAVVEETCFRVRAETGGIVEIANYNSPGQIVISGDHASLARAMSLAKEKARRVIPLAVSVAGHCTLMAPAAESLADAVEKTRILGAHTPVVANVNAQPIVEAKEIRKELVAQLTNPVRWTESVRYMTEHGVGAFVEVGPGTVLKGLIRRISKKVETRSALDPEGSEGQDS